MPRAEHFGDLTTADHKVPNEGCESRNNVLFAVVVQNLATQRIQSYPCKTKTSHKTQKKLTKVLGVDEETQKSFTLKILLNVGKLVKMLLGIIVRRYHADQKQIG